MYSVPAVNADDALEKIQRLNPDLIFLDIHRIDVILIDQNMPGLVGTETIKLINEKFDQTSPKKKYV